MPEVTAFKLFQLYDITNPLFVMKLLSVGLCFCSLNNPV